MFEFFKKHYGTRGTLIKKITKIIALILCSLYDFVAFICFFLQHSPGLLQIVEVIAFILCSLYHFVLAFVPFFQLCFFGALARVVILISFTQICYLIFYFYFCLFFHASFSRSYAPYLFLFILAHINQYLTLFFRSFKGASSSLSSVFSQVYFVPLSYLLYPFLFPCMLNHDYGIPMFSNT